MKIFKQVTQIVLFIGILFGLYIQINGEYSPGGGFQAGGIMASLIIAMDACGILNIKRDLSDIAALGCLIYVFTGFFALPFGLSFLNYSYIPIASAQSVGIFLIELGVLITVTATLVNIYLLLVK